MAAGLFVSFEGVDGSGKSTQSRMLASTLTDMGHDVVLTREPGGSDGAEKIRALLVEGDPSRWSAEAEILLFTAARRDHLERRITPALDAGQIVLCDRFADSTRVYQGATRGDLRSVVDQLHDMMIGREPDLTIVIDMDPAISLERGLARKSGEDRFEEFGAEFQLKLRDGFLALAQKYKARCVVVDGHKSAEELGAEIKKIVLDRLA
ncbi:MAG: dTMP kinase [Pseudomonadota bacterium]